jgi:hypothetical protein
VSLNARIYEPSPVAEPNGRRRRWRTRTRLTAQVSQADYAHHVLVHDLSADGMLLESEWTLRPGTTVTIEIDGFDPVEARIAWANGNFYGCTLSRPLAQGQVAAKLASSKVIWPHFGQREWAAIAPQAPRSPADLLRLPVAPAADTDWPATEAKWPLAARLLFIVGAAALCWAAVIGLVGLIARAVTG